MTRLRNPETGLVVSCEGDLVARYQSRGWVAADGAAEPAVEAASDEPRKEEPETVEADDEKPARRGQARRR